MADTQKLVADLKVRLRTSQPIVWIETDEPSRAAALIRKTILEFVHTVEKARKGDSAGDELSLFEHDLASGMSRLTAKGELITKKTPPGAGGVEEVIIGELVDFFNPGQKELPKHNYNPAAPWRFIVDMIERLPSRSIALCHNFGEIVDMALRVSNPNAGASMRNALLSLTGMLSAATSLRSFRDTGRVLVATGRLPHNDIARQEILDTFDILRLDRPSDEELAAMIAGLLTEQNISPAHRETLIKKNAVAYGTDDLNQQTNRAALAVVGLTAFAAETAVVRTFSATRHFDPAVLSAQRKTLIERSPGLTLVEPSPDFSWSRVKGLDQLERLAKRSLRPDVPAKLRINSMTFVGPPGSGKSMGAAALAQYLAVPLVKCNLSQVFSKFIGDSQRAMTTLLATIDSIGECVVLIDEADKQLDGLISDGGQRGDGGVGSQVMQLLLSWEQDRTTRKNRALIIKTANRIGNLRAESQRAGRNDVTFFVDFPHASIRDQIARQYLADYEVNIDEDTLQQLVTKTRMWSGAEIKELVKNVGRFGSLDEAFPYVKPIFEMAKAEITKMRDDAKNSGIAAGSLSVDNEDREAMQVAAAAATRSAMPGRMTSTITEDI